MYILNECFECIFVMYIWKVYIECIFLMYVLNVCLLCIYESLYPFSFFVNTSIKGLKGIIVSRKYGRSLEITTAVP